MVPVRLLCARCCASCEGTSVNKDTVAWWGDRGDTTQRGKGCRRGRQSHWVNGTWQGGVAEGDFAQEA